MMARRDGRFRQRRWGAIDETRSRQNLTKPGFRQWPLSTRWESYANSPLPRGLNRGGLAPRLGVGTPPAWSTRDRYASFRFAMFGVEWFASVRAPTALGRRGTQPCLAGGSI